jgi:hypothetical protein
LTRLLTSDEEIRSLLLNARTIAVVGISDRPERPSHGVARYLLAAGYTVVPVNPNLREWRGLEAFPTVEASGVKVDIVDVFRRPKFVPDVVEDAVVAQAGALWLQLGVINEEAAASAIARGMPVVMDRCTAIEHRRFLGAGGGER